MPPRRSIHDKLIEEIDNTTLEVVTALSDHLMKDDPASDSDSDIILSPPSPISPYLSDSTSSNSSNSSDMITRYSLLLDAISALQDEVEASDVLNRPNHPIPRAPQIQLLNDFAEDHVDLFRQKMRVNPAVFDAILDQISGHPVFQNNSNNHQLPIAIQLAVFLNRVGHYGNAASNQDIAQWAGIGVGSVTNCTNRVMVALLDQHNECMYFPTLDSDDAEKARQWVEERTCPEWRNGIFSIDGSATNLMNKPGLHGEVFFNRKSAYSLNCQVCLLFLILAFNLTFS